MVPYAPDKQTDDGKYSDEHGVPEHWAVSFDTVVVMYS